MNNQAEKNLTNDVTLDAALDVLMKECSNQASELSERLVEQAAKYPTIVAIQSLTTVLATMIRVSAVGVENINKSASTEQVSKCMTGWSICEKEALRIFGK